PGAAKAHSGSDAGGRNRVVNCLMACPHLVNAALKGTTTERAELHISRDRSETSAIRTWDGIVVVVGKNPLVYVATEIRLHPKSVTLRLRADRHKVGNSATGDSVPPATTTINVARMRRVDYQRRCRPRPWVGSLLPPTCRGIVPFSFSRQKGF